MNVVSGASSMGSFRKGTPGVVGCAAGAASVPAVGKHRVAHTHGMLVTVEAPGHYARPPHVDTQPTHTAAQSGDTHPPVTKLRSLVVSTNVSVAAACVCTRRCSLLVKLRPRTVAPASRRQKPGWFVLAVLEGQRHTTCCLQHQHLH